MVSPGVDVPYTHREVFLTSEYAVGMGLATYGGISDSQLEEKDSFQEVVDDLYTLNLVQSNDELWTELLNSQTPKELAKSEFTAEYITKNTSYSESEYRDLDGLLQEDNLDTATHDDIRLILGVNDAHKYIWNHRRLFNRLLRNHENWMDFFPNLSTMGDPLPRMDEETKIQLGLYAIGKYGQDPYQVYNDQSNIDALLKSSNSLEKNLMGGIVTNHPTWINAISNSSNTHGWNASSWGSTDNWRDSSYSYGPGIYFMRRSMTTRELIAQSQLGINDPDFSFLDLFNGNIVNDFWNSNGSVDPMNQLNGEFFREARAQHSEHNRNRGSVSANGNISGGSNLTVSAGASAYATNYNNEALSASAPAHLKTEPVDVSNKNSVTINFRHVTGGSSRSAPWYGNNVKATVGIGSGQYKQWDGNESSNNSLTFNISNRNSIRFRFNAGADARSRTNSNSSQSSSASAHIDISNINIS